MTPEQSDILLGDSLKILQTLPENFFQLILADPPYEISRPNNFKTMGRHGMDFGSWDKKFDQLTWIDLATKALKPGGSAVIFNDWKKLGLIAEFLEKLEFNSIKPLIWHKTNPGPFNSKHVFLQSTEFAVWATKKKTSKSKTVFNSGYHHGIFNDEKSVMSIDHSIQRSEHPTKKPDKLFGEIINILTNPNDWILDPFIGSGTTAVACNQTGRNFIGIEKDPEFHRLAVNSWKKNV
jgi:DNA modification methylase